jgi:hypothetical protein
LQFDRNQHSARLNVEEARKVHLEWSGSDKGSPRGVAAL